MTERRRGGARHLDLAHNDFLTGLPNRASLLDYLARDPRQGPLKNGGQQFAVMCLDLDRFKEANYVYGHLVGDGCSARRPGGCMWPPKAPISRARGVTSSLPVVTGDDPQERPRLSWRAHACCL